MMAEVQKRNAVILAAPRHCYLLSTSMRLYLLTVRLSPFHPEPERYHDPVVLEISCYDVEIWSAIWYEIDKRNNATERQWDSDTTTIAV